MATNQSLQRFLKLILLATGVLATSLATRAADWLPMLPDQDFYDFQLFAPPDMQDYEIYPEPSEGFFFNYDRLYWGISVPKTVGTAETRLGGYLIPVQPISPQTIVQLNNDMIAAGQPASGLFIFGTDVLSLDLNTSWLRTDMTWGNRYEGGWIYDNRGILLSYFDTGEQPQNFQTINEFAASSPTQTFTQSGQTPEGGGLVGGGNALNSTTIVSTSPPPDHLIAQKMVQMNTTRIQSAAVTSLIRREIGGRGSRSNVKFSLGPRFVQFEDRYNIAYESNQYAFNTAGYGGGTTAGGTTAGTTGTATAGGTTGGTTGGFTTGTATAGATGGATTGGATAGATGGTTGGVTGTINGDTALAETSSSAGDFFAISGVDTLTGKGRGSPLQTGAWESYTTNNMVGPEFAILMESQKGRWTFTSQLKFTPAFNWQNSLFRGANFPESLGADYIRSTFQTANTSSNQGFNDTPVTVSGPPLFLQLYGVGQSNTTNSAEHEFVFSPIGEWRFSTQFRVSQAISLNLGYTGMWMAGITRASSNTGYRSKERATEYAYQPPVPATNPPTANLTPWQVKRTVPVAKWIADGRPATERPNPVYNSIAPVEGGNEYIFTNGIDFGIEVKY
jgi:hypothetical protein